MSRVDFELQRTMKYTSFKRSNGDLPELYGMINLNCVKQKGGDNWGSQDYFAYQVIFSTQMVTNKCLLNNITIKLEVGSTIVLVWVCGISFKKSVNGSQKVKKRQNP